MSPELSALAFRCLFEFLVSEGQLVEAIHALGLLQVECRQGHRSHSEQNGGAISDGDTADEEKSASRCRRALRGCFFFSERWPTLDPALFCVSTEAPFPRISRRQLSLRPRNSFNSSLRRGLR